MKPSQVQIREAAKTDIQNIVSLLKKFYKLSKQAKAGYSYGPDRIAALTSELIDKDEALVLVAIMNERLVGVAISLLTPLWFLEDTTAGQEIVWFVEKEFRGMHIGNDLFDTTEFWAKANGAKYMMMVNLDHLDPKAKEMYLAKGYEQQETVYVKEF